MCPFCSQDYIAVKEKYAKYLPHSAGRYQVKRFRKAQCPIVERLVCSLMMHGRNNGKKLMAMRIVKHAFEIIHLLTGEVIIFVCTNNTIGFEGRNVMLMLYMHLRKQFVILYFASVPRHCMSFMQCCLSDSFQILPLQISIEIFTR